MKAVRSNPIGLFLAVILLIAALSACAQSNEGAPANQSAAAQESGNAEPAPSESAISTEAEAQEGGTVTYEAANGKIEIPAAPQRVVVLADSYAGDFLALGLKPVGLTQSALDNPYFEGMTDGIANLGDGTSEEKVLELNPDLIIMFNGTEQIEKFEKIAPTVAIQYGTLDYREQLLEFGKITGREAQAKQWISEWDEKIDDYKPKVEAAVGDKTVSILNPYAKGIYAFGHNYGRGGEILYGEFQLKAPELIQKEAIDSGQGWAELSLERLPDYAGDYIFTCPWSGDEADPSAVYDSKLWLGLPAVKEDRVFQLDPKGAYFNDPISLQGQLEFIVDKLM